MKKILLLVLFAFTALYPQSPVNKISGRLMQKIESAADNQKLLVWIFFTDKGEKSALLKSPESVVSRKSLDRRKKVLPENELINFQDLPVSSDYIDRLTSIGFQLKQKSKWFNGVSGFISKNDLFRTAVLPFVKEADLVAQLSKKYEETESGELRKSDEPSGINVLNYGQSYTQLQQINVPALHNLGYFGQGVTICVMDAGFSLLSHECFSAMHIIARWDFVNHNWGVGDSTDMGSGTHGTETLSTIGGFKDGQQIGPAFQSNYILAKTENTDSETPIEEDNWIAAVEWADSIGVDVTSTSLGYIGYDFPFVGYTWQSMNGNTARITIAADLAVARGIVVVNSAGNEGYDVHNTLGAPADGDSVIAVGSVGSDGIRSYFSSVGPTVDGRIKPDVMAMGSSTHVASPYSTTGYTYSSGTSFSCPLAAGVAALILCYNPNLTPIQVREAMRMTASRYNNPDNQYGWGILNALNAANYFPTPVELTSFSALRNGSGIELSWETTTEKNNSGFEIERSVSGSGWINIGFVRGAGTTSEKHEYNFTDASPLKGMSSYRLKQIDLDGTFSYSRTVEVEVTSPDNFSLAQNYPNPFNPSTKIRFTIPAGVNSNVKLKVYDVLGNEVASVLDEQKAPGEYEIEFNASSLSAGIYFYALTAGNYSSVKKLVFLK